MPESNATKIVRALVTAIGTEPGSGRLFGHEYELDADHADRLIEAGQAELVEAEASDKKKKRK